LTDSIEAVDGKDSVEMELHVELEKKAIWAGLESDEGSLGEALSVELECSSTRSSKHWENAKSGD
jgi:hypothetical protein